MRRAPVRGGVERHGQAHLRKTFAQGGDLVGNAAVETVTGSRVFVYAALVGDSGIAVAKFVAASLMGSSALLAEAVHSIAHTGNHALMLPGLHRG